MGVTVETERFISFPFPKEMPQVPNPVEILSLQKKMKKKDNTYEIVKVWHPNKTNPIAKHHCQLPLS